MFETLRKSGAIDAMARQLGVAPSVAYNAARLLLPDLVQSFRRRSSSAGGGEAGLRDLVEMLGILGGGELASHILSVDTANVRIGDALLVLLFGSSEAARDHAESAQSGLEPELARKMFALLAMAVGGYLAARMRGLDLTNSNGVVIEDLLEAEDN